jgi:hypothetical protein
MSLECAQKANITLWATNTMYSISTPRGQVVADHMVHKIPLELAGRAFSTSLIILEGEGIDVILGMNRMKLHKAVMDISTRLVQLDPPNFGKISLQLPPVARLQASVHAVIAMSLNEIPVVYEYLDVFLNDLPGMPADRAIEFKIKL